MKMTITKTSVKIQQKAKANFHENFLANASITFFLEEGGHFTISGFSVWKSKFDPTEINVEPPGNKFFKYTIFENSLWIKIKKEIIDEYQKYDIEEYFKSTNSSNL